MNQNIDQEQQTQDPNENEIEEHHPINQNPTIPTAAHSQISFDRYKKNGLKSFMNGIAISYFLMGMTLLLFGLFLCLRLDDDLDWKYSIVGIPFSLFITSTTVCFYKIICHPSLNYQDLGKHLTLFSVTSGLSLIGVTEFLLMLRLDNFIRWDYTIIFVPLYIGLSISLFYICFIFPGMIDKEVKLYNEAFLVSLYYFGSLVWIIMLNLKLDGYIHWYNYKVFLVLFIVLGTHLMLSVKKLFETENLMGSFQNFIFVLIMTFCLMILVMKIDGLIDKSWCTSCLPLLSLILLTYAVNFNTIFEKFRN